MKFELTKRCTHCEQFLVLSKMHSWRTRTGQVRYRSICKKCQSNYVKARRKEMVKKNSLFKKSSTSICVFEKLLQKVPVAKFLAEAA